MSEEESQYIAYQLFNKEVENYTDLSNDEQKIYNRHIASMGKEFQDEMAKNFNKEELNIRTGRDLFYIGVVENKRTYSQYDDEVIADLKKMVKKKKDLIRIFISYKVDWLIMENILKFRRWLTKKKVE